MPTGPLHAVLRHLAETDRTDAQLLADHVGRGDAAALAALVRRHAAMVWGVCRRLLPREADAEDAFQATFLVLVRRAASIASPERLAGWLHGVAYQTARKARAMAGRRAARERQVPALPETPVTEADRTDAAALDAALAALPEVYRVAVVLCDLEGMTRTEAARLLGVPEGTLAARVARGRRLLGRRLGDRPPMPPLPAGLVTATLETATTRTAPATVVSLAEGVLHAMLLTRLKTATMAVLGLALLAGLATLAAPVPDPAASWKEILVLRHDHAVTAVACTEAILAVGDAGGNVFLYDAKTGKDRRHAVQGGKSFKAVDRVQIQTDGQWMYAVFNGRKTMFQTDLRKDGLPAYGTGPANLGVSADGAWWLDTRSPRVLLVRPNLNHLDTNPGRRHDIEDSVRYEAEVTEAGFSPDGRWLAVLTADSQLRVYDWAAADRDLAKTPDGTPISKRPTNAFAFSKDGKGLVVVGEDGFAALYDPATGKERVTLKGHRGLVFCACFSPDGKTVVTGGDDNVARVWDAATGKLLAVLAGHTDSVRVATFDMPGDRVLTGSADKTLRAWRLAP